MLETLLLESVSADPAMPCVDEFLDCLLATELADPQNLTKARFQAFLVSRRRGAVSTSVAIERGDVPMDHPVFEPLRGFLMALAQS